MIPSEKKLQIKPKGIKSIKFCSAFRILINIIKIINILFKKNRQNSMCKTQ